MKLGLANEDLADILERRNKVTDVELASFLFGDEGNKLLQSKLGGKGGMNWGILTKYGNRYLKLLQVAFRTYKLGKIRNLTEIKLIGYAASSGFGNPASLSISISI